MGSSYPLLSTVVNKASKAERHRAYGEKFEYNSNWHTNGFSQSITDPPVTIRISLMVLERRIGVGTQFLKVVCGYFIFSRLGSIALERIPFFEYIRCCF